MNVFKQIVCWWITTITFVWCIHEWGFASDGPGYISSDWRRAASVAVFSIAAGVLVSVTMGLPEAARRRTAAVVFGSAVWLAMTGCAFSLWQVSRMREFRPDGR